MEFEERMLERRNDDSSTEPGWFDRFRVPALTVAVSLAIGIAVDRWLPIPLVAWLTIAISVCLVWLLCFVTKRNSRAAAVTLLITCLAVGALRHHAFWYSARLNDIGNAVSDEPRLVKLTGRIVSAPEIIVADQSKQQLAIPQSDRSICTMECQSVVTDGASVLVTGKVRMQVSGQLKQVALGDVVEVVGWLSAPASAKNPGEFDFRDYLRRDQIRTVLKSDFASSVQVLEKRTRWSLARFRNKIRSDSQSTFSRMLSPRAAPVASALLLGSRTQMPDEIRRHFAESGTIHLLAISGLHVGILAVLLLASCRLLNCSQLTTAGVLIVGVLWYLMITDSRPPVVRASILVFLFAVSLLKHRPTSAANSLSVAAIAVLLWNPTDLFDAGAQLSFVAVAAILWSTQFTSSADPATPQLPDESIAGRIKYYTTPFVRFLKHSYLVTLAIWLFTAPLVLWSFNLVSPIGIVLNVVLIPFVALALWSGYGLLVTGLLFPPLASVFAFLFDGLLSSLLRIVDWAAQVDLGHRYLADPPTWWIFGCYLLVTTIICVRTSSLSKHWGWRGLWVWIIVGLAVGLRSSDSGNLRCTFLSVGHGLSVLVETPSGRTLLYDSGSINNPERAANVVQGVMWHRGATRLDAVVISHADVDHFNSVPHLIKAIPVDSIVTTRSFLDMLQSGVKAVCDAAQENDIPISLVFGGDEIILDERVGIRVMHPRLGFHSNSDNANSLVLELQYASKKILLTGDLELDGLDALLRKDTSKYDVVLAPHHGSLAANPTAFGEWANPTYVVASGGRKTPIASLRQRYGVNVLSTHQDGAITVEIDADGEVTVTPFRPQTTSIWSSQHDTVR